MSAPPPNRLIEDDAEAAGLRLDLQRASDHSVDYDVAAGVAAFEATLANGPPPADPASAASSGLGGAKLALLVVGVAAVVGAGAVALSGSSEGAADRDPVVAQQVAVPDEAAAVESGSTGVDAPNPAEAGLADEGTPAAATDQPEAHAEATDGPQDQGADEDAGADVVAPPEKKAGRRPTKSQPTKSSAKPADSPDRLKAEMEATNRARTALASDPAKALRLARKADADFPSGLFAEQRAGVRALALFATGADAKARKAGSAYLRKYPRGTYADKIRAAIAKKP